MSLDEQIAHTVNLAKAINRLSNAPGFDLDFRRAVSAVLADVEEVNTRKELKALQDQLILAITPVLDSFEAEYIDDLAKIAQLEVDFQSAQISIAPVTVDAVVTKALAREVPVGNNLSFVKVSDMLAQQRAFIEKNVKGTASGVYFNNDPISAIKTRINGSSALGYKDGIAKKAQRDLQTIKRTSLNVVENEAKTLVFKKAGADGYIYNSVVDVRTSSMCRSLHGQKYIYGQGRNPIPPMHYNCRSSMVPFFKGEPNELEGQNYYTWLKRQPASVQDEVLGVERGKIFRNADIPPSEFKKLVVNSFAEELTIDELAQKDKRVKDYLNRGQGPQT